MVGYKAKRLNTVGNGFVEQIDNVKLVHYSSIDQNGYRNLQDVESEKINTLNVSTNYQSSNVLDSKSQIIV